jgi:hypothetical protein
MSSEDKIIEGTQTLVLFFVTDLGELRVLIVAGANERWQIGFFSVNKGYCVELRPHEIQKRISLHYCLETGNFVELLFTYDVLLLLKLKVLTLKGHKGWYHFFT